jgi:excisionase family DNA binding protein
MLWGSRVNARTQFAHAKVLNHKLQLLRLKQVAQLLGISEITIRRRVREGSLPHIRIKGQVYFRPHEVKAYIDRHAEPTWEP